ncbi:Uncharacterised protein [Mycobacterium tuberculosis]|nr:Uncharacterised protein [Mycobacterium tuberculosis]
MSKSCLPVRSNAEEDSSATATCGVGVSTAANPPAMVSAISSNTPPDNRRRRRRRVRPLLLPPDRVNPSFVNRALLFVGCSSDAGSSDEIDHGE